MMPNSQKPQRAFFGRRKGHPLRPRQAALFETLLPKLALDFTKSAPTDLRTLYANVDDVRLEIGFGGAEHLIAQAQANARSGFIGSDGYSNAIAKALTAIDDGKLSNIRLHHGDASALIDWLPPGAVHASTYSIPIRGRSGGTGNAASSRTRASSAWRDFFAVAASCASPQIFPIMRLTR